MKSLLKKSQVIWISCLGMVGLLAFSSFLPNHRGTRRTSLGVMKVVIDAGHGGHDPGNLGTGRYKDTEKDIALDVSLQLGEYILRAFPNVDVIYTRKDDKFVELKNRTAIANKAGADLFISIHCNSAASHEAAGTETFSMALTKSKANIELAMRENSVIMLEEGYEQSYGGFDPNDPEALIARSIIQGVYLDQSLSLSAKIQEQYRERVGRKDRGVKQAPYWVISFTTMPSILTELGFLTNKAEEDFLNSENGKIYMASAIYRAFKSYKEEIEGVQIGVPEVDEIKPETPTVVEKETPKAEQKEEKPEPKTEVEQVNYRIQLLVSSKRIPLKPENFNGLENVEEYEVDGLYKYTIGNVSDYKKAVSLQRTVREQAYPKAFIIAFYKGERIAISDALDLAKAQN